MNLGELNNLAIQYASKAYDGDDFQTVVDTLNALTVESKNSSPITFLQIAALFGITDATGAKDLLNKLFSNVDTNPLNKVLVDRLIGVGADLSDPLMRAGIEELRNVVGTDMTDQILALGIKQISLLSTTNLGADTVTAKDVQDAKADATSKVTIQQLTNYAANIYSTVLGEIQSSTLTDLAGLQKRITELNV